MCGIVGVLNLQDRPPVDEATMHRMLGMLRHRGPDGFGVYRDRSIGLGHARLSIIDLTGGDQPIGNEDGRLWIVFNGEIFNYLELRPELEARGHRFSTHTDTEVLLHLFEEYGPACLGHLNGQFAIAIWDSRARSLFLARDRLGVRPLFYAMHDGRLVFGSEVKALLAYPGMRAEIDPQSLDQIFTFWSTLSPNTVFRGIQDVPPGHYLLADWQGIKLQQYWALDFDTRSGRREEAMLDELEDLLIDATRLRLRADVPVGAYLSGGLDSSITTAIIRRYTQSRLDTFSIAFVDDAEFDEAHYQRRMAAFLGTDHHAVGCTHADIARVFSEVIWHTETPVLRTAPAPMFLLSKLVQDHSLKVVVTGEGADEFLAGYDIFKEAQVRRFWARNPDSQLRPLLLRRLYPEIDRLGLAGEAMRVAFFKKGLADVGSPFYSHAIRWDNTARIRRFLAHGEAPGQSPAAECDRPSLPDAFSHWAPLSQAQYLEISVFLSQYLLSSQGDRMGMAHSVEGRFPFLDHRLVEFCNHLPPHVKLRGLTEKWLLRQLGCKLLPAEIWQRPKRPYRAPIHRSFFGASVPSYVTELLSREALQATGLFNADSVGRLVAKAESRARLSEVEDMALAGILSTQLVHHHFVTDLRTDGLRSGDRIRTVEGMEGLAPIANRS